MDPAVEQSLKKLAQVLAQVSEASESLNATISEFEGYLLELSPGITAWCEKPLRIRPVTGETATATGSQLGFMKFASSGWGLAVRRGRFVLQSKDVWVPDTPVDWNYVKLVDANREERAAALAYFPLLVDGITKAAQSHLRTLQRANLQAEEAVDKRAR